MCIRPAVSTVHLEEKHTCSHCVRVGLEQFNSSVNSQHMEKKREMARADGHMRATTENRGSSFSISLSLCMLFRGERHKAK